MKHEYWFPARPPERGWGWGLPQTWQGWVVFLGYWVLLAAGIVLILPHHVGGLLAYITAISALLIFICAKKGEPPGGGPKI